MQKVLVLDKNKKPLMPCHPARSRQLLKKRKAAVFRKHPFTIILKEREGGDTQNIELKIDPGSKESGIALVADYKRGKTVLFSANLEHRGQKIKDSLEKRRAIRRSRRNRKTRYRPARFDNRTRPQGWLPPSLMSRLYNIFTWAKRFISWCPIIGIAVETVRFDTQKIQNPEISGKEYQRGTLADYELREYLLEKWGRKCAYCGVENVPLEKEHIIARSKGGSNRASNFTLACRPCNQAKGNLEIKDFVKDKKKLQKILAHAKAPLKDTAAVNATRYAIGNKLKELRLPVDFWSGGRTKKNRVSQGYQKDHWIDAACVGESGASVSIPPNLNPLLIKANGHKSRQMCRVDKFGFPRTSAKTLEKVKGFRTGDIVKAVVTKGKKVGTYVGRLSVRSTGNFNIKTKNGTIQGIGAKYCKLIQQKDGYAYA